MTDHDRGGEIGRRSASAVQDLLPQLAEIRDAQLRERVLDVWLSAWRQTGWDDLRDVPYSSLIPDPELGLMSHTRTVAAGCIGLAEAQIAAGIAVDMDVLIAGALLHDVCKLLELDVGTKGKSPLGEALPHGLLSVDLARGGGLPVTVLHIIASHTPALATTPQTVEAVILHYADYAHYNCLRLRHGHVPVHLH